MITNFNDLGREEFLQYITLCYTYFYNLYDHFTENERNYLKEFIDKLDEVYHV